MKVEYDKYYPIIENQVSSGEKVLYAGRPALSDIFSRHFIVIFVCAFSMVGANAITADMLKHHRTPPPFLSFYLTLVGVALYLIYRIVKNRTTYFGYTGKCLVLVQGIFGRKGKVVDFDRVQTITVKQNALEKLLNTGTIVAYSGQVDDEDVHDYIRGVEDVHVMYTELSGIFSTYKSKHPNVVLKGGMQAEIDEILEEAQKKLDRIEATLNEIEKDSDDDFDESSSGGSREKAVNRTDLESCEVCGMIAVDPSTDSCENCFSDKWDEDESDGTVTKSQWLRKEQLDWFCDSEFTEAEFYEVSDEGFKRDPKWKPSITVSEARVHEFKP